MGRNDDLLDQSLPREIPMKRGLLRCSCHVLSFRVPDFKWCLYKYVCTVTVYIHMIHMSVFFLSICLMFECMVCGLCLIVSQFGSPLFVNWPEHV